MKNHTVGMMEARELTSDRMEWMKLGDLVVVPLFNLNDTICSHTSDA